MYRLNDTLRSMPTWHRRHLTRLVRFTRSARKRGYSCLSTAEQFASVGLPHSPDSPPGLVVPCYDMLGNRIGERIRFDGPGRAGGTGLVRWWQHPDYVPTVNVHPGTNWLIKSSAPYFVVTGNAIDADYASARAVPAASCDWELGLNEDDPFFSTVRFHGRQVILIIGPRQAMNSRACEAFREMASTLVERGAVVSRYCLPIDDTLDQLGRVKYIKGLGYVDRIRIRHARRKRRPHPGDILLGGPNAYRLTEQGILRIGPDKKHEDVLVTNFVARITRCVEFDDGYQTSMEYEVTATIDGQDTTLTIPARDYQRMEWVADLGPTAIVYPGLSAKEHARVAIQEASVGHKTVRAIGHSGWLWHAERWWFAHAGGLIGPAIPARDWSQGAEPVAAETSENKGVGVERPMRPIVARIEVPADVEVRLPQALDRFRLTPPTGENLNEQIKEVHELLYEVFPARLVSPLLAAVFRIAIDKVDFGVHLHGTTNVGKSVLAALMSQFFGAGLDQRHLPGSWNSTSNFLLSVTGVAKNVLYVVDDFVPKGSRGDVNRAHQNADTLLRAAGNQSFRGRCNRDGTARPGQSPQCLILSTGEEVPHGHSLAARLLILEVREGEVISTCPTRMAALTKIQKLADGGRFAEIMSSFLSWVAMKREVVLCEHRSQVEILRREIFPAEGRLARTVSMGAELMSAYEVFLDFWNEHHGLGFSKHNAYYLRMCGDLHSVLDEQTRNTVDANPAVLFMTFVREALATGRGHVLPKNEGVLPSNHEWYGLQSYVHRLDPAPPSRESTSETGASDDEPAEEPPRESVVRLVGRGKQIGYWHAGVTYLLAAAALEVVQELAERSSLQPLPLTTKTLGGVLHRLGVLRQKPQDGHFAEKHRINGKELRMLAISDALLFKDWTKGDEPAEEKVDEQRSFDELLDA